MSLLDERFDEHFKATAKAASIFIAYSNHNKKIAENEFNLSVKLQPV